MNTLEIDKLTKIYKLYERPSARLKELLLRRPFHREFVALNEISFRVKKGETLGIIGENGAGKSTLLKIIAKTLKQSAGRVVVNGRVSSLLELGSGFHPEFTGMENIYFYGTLLGISPAEMKHKVDEIIAFSEIGEHINYPLKTYSSGMYVRLAFSVATAIDPDILVIDEALSVGDLHFQKKSTERIVSFKDQDKTILFCSHSMYHVTRICDRVLWFMNGRIHMEGSPFEVVQAYETYQLEKNGGSPVIRGGPESASSVVDDCGGIPLMIQDIQLLPIHDVRTGDTLTARIHIAVKDDTIRYRVAAKIRRIDGLDIFGTGTNDQEPFTGSMVAGIRFPNIQLREGTFFIEAFLFDEDFVHIFHRMSSAPFLVPKETLEVGMVKLPYEWIIRG